MREEGNGGVDEEQIAGDRGVDPVLAAWKKAKPAATDPAIPPCLHPPPQILASCKKRKGANEPSRKRKG